MNKKITTAIILIFSSILCYAEKDRGIWKFEDRIVKCDKSVIKEIENDVEGFEERACEDYAPYMPFNQFYFWIENDNDDAIIYKYLKAGNAKVVDFLISNFEYYQKNEYIISACESGNKETIDFILKYDEKLNDFSIHYADDLCERFGNSSNPIVLNAVAKYCSKSLETDRFPDTFPNFIEDHKDMFEYAVKNKILNANIKYEDMPCFFYLMYRPKNFSEEERLELMQLMFDAEADINATENNNRTALFYAVERNSVNLINFLIKNGIDTSIADSGGESPLFIAIRHKNTEVADILINTGKGLNIISQNGYTPLSCAIHENQFDIAKKLIAAGADVNNNKAPGYTALSEACSANNLELVKLLVEHGADVNLASEKQMYHPLERAVRKDNYEMVKYLIDNGSKVNVINSNGENELFEVTSNKDTRIIELLIEKGADINLQNKDGETPLFYAFMQGYDAVESAAMLIKYGADINVLNNKNESVLFDAYRNPELVEFYIKNGVDLSVVNKDGETAYDYAYRKTGAGSKKKKTAKDKEYEQSLKILQKAMK